MAWPRAGLAAVTLASVLAGCSGATPTVSYVVDGSSAGPSLLSDLARMEAVPVRIAGQPFADDAPTLDRIVARDLVRGLPINPGVAFRVTEAGGERPAGYRVVLAFHPAAGANLAKICTEAPRTRAPVHDGGRVRLAAALCADRKMMRRTRASVGRAADPKAPGFRRLIRQVSSALFSRTSDDLDGADGGPSFP